MDSKEQRDLATQSIIRNHIIWSMGSGLIPLPVVDFIAVSAVQLDMVRQLSKLYGVDYKESEGKAVITSLTGTGLAQLSARAAVKLVPGVGSIVGGVTMSVLSGASTYAIGQVFKTHFETGGTFLDFDPNRLKKYYQEQFEKGKQVARDLKRDKNATQKQATSGGFTRKTAPADEQPTPATDAPGHQTDAQDLVVQKIKELAALKAEGLLSEEEFQQMKQKVLDRY